MALEIEVLSAQGVQDREDGLVVEQDGAEYGALRFQVAGQGLFEADIGRPWVFSGVDGDGPFVPPRREDKKDILAAKDATACESASAARAIARVSAARVTAELQKRLPVPLPLRFAPGR